MMQFEIAIFMIRMLDFTQKRQIASIQPKKSIEHN